MSVNLSWERSLADTRDISLGDADDRADARGADASPSDCTAGRRAGAGDERIRAVVDIEQRALRAFEHHILAVVECVVEKVRGIGDEGGDLLSGASVILIHLARIERLSAKKCVRDGVLLVAGVVDVRAQQRSVEQIDDAQAVAVDLVLIRGADAATRSADGLAAGRSFG